MHLSEVYFSLLSGSVCREVKPEYNKGVWHSVRFTPVPLSTKKLICCSAFHAPKVHGTTQVPCVLFH